MSKYDKSFNIFLTNKTQNGLTADPKTLFTFNFSKPIIIPPYSTYSLTNFTVNRNTNASVMFVFSINEFDNKTYVCDRDGGRVFNGLLHMASQLKTTPINTNQKFQLCNKEPITLSSITLRSSDINGKPQLLTTNGLNNANSERVELGINIKIEQDEKYQMMSVQKRNQELMAGLMAQKKEYNQ